MLLTFGGRGYTLHAGETVLEGLTRHGVGLPSACRAGACHSCLLRAETGDPGKAGREGLKPALAAGGDFLAGRGRPASDVTVTLAGGDVFTPATLLRSERLAADVLAVWLRPHRRVSFRAGQHVTLSRPGGVIRPYSIANLPAEADRDGMEFHLRVYSQGAMSGWLAAARPGAELSIGIPAGQCFYLPGDPTAPLLLAGTGTGIAPLLAIARDAEASGHTGPVVVIHGARDPGRLYLGEQSPRGRVADDGGSVIRWRTCVRSRGEDIVVAVAAEFTALTDPMAAHAYLCGGAGSVTRMRRALFMAGMSLRAIDADQFLPAVSPGLAVSPG